VNKFFDLADPPGFKEKELKRKNSSGIESGTFFILD